MCTKFEWADIHALLDILDRTGVSTINTAWRYTTDLPVHVISGVLKVGQNGHRHVELGELILGDGTEAAIFDSTKYTGKPVNYGHSITFDIFPPLIFSI